MRSTFQFEWRSPRALSRYVGIIVLLAAIVAGVKFAQAGVAKWDDPAWTGERAGIALEGFLKGAHAKSLKSERNPYPDVLPPVRIFNDEVVAGHARLFAWLVVLGELLVPPAVLVLLCVRFPGSRAALLGVAGLAASMNFLYLHEGSAGINPAMLFMWLAVVWLVALLPTAACAYALDLGRLFGQTPHEQPAALSAIDPSPTRWLFFTAVLMVILLAGALMYTSATFLMLLAAGVGLAALLGALDACLARALPYGRPRGSTPPADAVAG